MRLLPGFFLRWLTGRCLALSDRREPDFVIGSRDDPYLLRWWVIPRNRWFNIYLHRFLRSDDDRALHDHPWVNASVLLDGTYVEHTSSGAYVRRAGCVYVRGAVAAHRVELHDGPVWTLFLTGPRVRDWGFICPQGWRHWKQFVAPGSGSGTGGSRTGVGCGEP